MAMKGKTKELNTHYYTFQFIKSLPKFLANVPEELYYLFLQIFRIIN